MDVSSLPLLPLLCHRERQHVPVAEYAQNLEQMVVMAQAADISSLVLITPPPVGDAARIKHQQMVSRTISMMSSHPACHWPRIHLMGCRW
jgi:hypothetical protein